MSTENPDKKFFCFGLGFSGQAVARKLQGKGWLTGGTCREAETISGLKSGGHDVHSFDGEVPMKNFDAALVDITHILITIPPSPAYGDPVLHHHADALAALPGLEWVGYLSTTGVYGDTGGKSVDETAPLAPTSERSRRRAEADQGWRGLHTGSGLPVHVFRLPGIYGPGRSALDQVRAGKARQIVKPDHKFSRIHVDDIANVVTASIMKPNPGAIYNVADNEATAPADVTAFACELLGIEPPPLVSFEEAKQTMSPMALSFWDDNRLIDNTRIRSELGVVLEHSTYREGLRAILAS